MLLLWRLGSSASCYAKRMFFLKLSDFEEARSRIAQHIKHTPLLTSRQLSERTGYDVRLKAEMFQRVGSYKIRGPLNKFALMPEEQKQRGVVCSSAGNHAQGVALAAKIHGIQAVVCMAENATPAKIAATRGYGAEVASQIQEEAFDYLDAPVGRVGAPFSPVPFTPVLEKLYVPNADRIVAEARRILGRQG